jgi:(R,R)-butanediol dehydrogenase/meso-butanediol dehydrogenase/diacetyl reductase
VRAVKLVEAHRLELVEVDDPHPAADEVVVRVNGCGICGSDLSSYKVGLFTDGVPGHEFSGVVEEVGGDVRGWRAGDRTVVDPKMPCGVCEECTSGNAHRCAIALTAGLGFARPGAFAERVVAPARLLHRLPQRLPLEVACLVEPLSIAVHGVERASALLPDRPPWGELRAPAVVVGLGPIGLFTVAVLRHRGAADIVGVDPVPDRRRLAAELGAGTVLAGPAEVRAAAQPSPAVFECSGNADVLHVSADLVAPGGVLVLLGVPFGEARVAPLMWVTREIAVLGSIASSADDFAASIAMLDSDPSLARIVTRRVPLEQVPAAFEELIAPTGGGKVVVDPAL